MKTLLTSMSIILLYSFAHAQAVISPKNWYKGVSTPLENNMFINLEDKQQFYLIANSVYIPFNISNDICSPASAKLTKIDVNGNVLATFQANGSVIDSYSMRGFYTSVITDQIIYFVSWENSKFQQYGSSKGFIIYHLNINSLKLLSTDTIKGIIPESMSIISWKSVDYGGYSFQAFTYQPFKGGSIKNKIIRIKLKTAGVEYVTLDLDSLMSQKQIGINNVSNVYLKNDSMVYTICGYDSNINNSEIYQLLRIDTSLKGFSYYNLEKENEFTYTFGRVAYMDYFPPTYELNNGKVVLGSQINTYDKMNGSRIDNAGMFYYDIKSKKPEKVLIIPNSTFTLSQISYAFFAPIAIKDSNIFCAAFDYYDYNTVYIDFRENHIYVGKTDTSLNGWHWYKYIGKPNCYLVPYKILATPDGGCMITAGIYDYVNSPNMQHDIYIIKLDANGGITSVNNLTPQPDKSVSLYPVPAQHQLFVSFSGSGHFDLQLYDMAGKMVGSYPNLDKQTRSLDISTLASGSYFYTVKHSNGSTETGKWIKE